MLTLSTIAKRILCAITLVPLSCTFVYAADFPNKPVRFIVPFPAGGNMDTHARIVGRQISDNWSQQAIIDNRPGAAGNIGMAIAARSPADGYTLVWAGASTLSVAPHVYRDVGYDLEKQFSPVIRAVDNQNILVVHPSLPVKNVKELIALAKSKPGALSFASSGTGTISHLGGEMFKGMSNTDILHVPYKGSSPAMAELLSGQVQIMWDSIASAMPQVQAGRLRALAVTGKVRTKIAPNLPTIAESGLPAFEIVNWLGILAPKGVGSDVIKKLNTDLSTVLKTSVTRDSMLKYGAEPVVSTPEDFAIYIREDRARWGAVVKKVGLEQK